MARKAGLKRKKTGKTEKTGKGPTGSLELEAGDVEGEVEIGLGSAGARVTVSETDTTSLELVAEIDISPLNFDVDYNAATNELSGEVAIGLPGDLVGITGGLTINAETGEVTAITGGVALAGMEVKVERGVGKHACRTVSTITFFGVGYSVTKDECEDEEEDAPSPPPADNGSDYLPPPIDIDPDLYPPSTLILAVVDWRMTYLKIVREVDGVIMEWHEQESYYKKGNVIRIGEDPEDWEYSSTYERMGVEYKKNGPGGFGLGWFDADGEVALSGKRDPFYYGTYGGLLECATRTYYEQRVLPRGSVAYKNGAYTRGDLEVYPYDDSSAQGWERYVTNRKIGDDGDPNTGEALNYDRRSSEMLMINVNIYPIPYTELPPPPTPRPRPRNRPRPHTRGENSSMSEDCCMATYQLCLENKLALAAIANVTGISEAYGYPVPVEGADGATYDAQNLLDYLVNQQRDSSLEKLLGAIPEESVFPIEILVTETPTDRRPKKLKINNIVELMQAVGASTGYRESSFEVKFNLTNDSRTFTYSNLGTALVDLLSAIAPHKMAYGTKDNGFVIPMEQLFPGSKGYDSTKDYPGVLTRLFSATQRYGFDSPITIKIKDANPALQGDQSVEEEYENLAGAIEKILNSHYELRGDLDAQTNLLIRLGYLTSRTHQLLVRTFYRVTALLDGLKIPTKNVVKKIKFEFDPFAGKEVRGFGRTSDNGDILAPEDLDLHDDDTTEKLLPKFLSLTTISQVVSEWKSKKPTRSQNDD